MIYFKCDASWAKRVSFHSIQHSARWHRGENEQLYVLIVPLRNMNQTVFLKLVLSLQHNFEEIKHISIGVDI